MTARSLLILFALCLLTTAGRAADLPPDVPRAHWAASAVQQTLENGVLAPEKGKAFHGEAKVTRTQAAIALAKLGRVLEAGKWHKQPSVALPVEEKQPALQGNWEAQPLTRYALASLLARTGDYFANGQHRAPVNSKDTARSGALPLQPKITLPRTHPAYDAVTYLASRRMVTMNSPLLKPDSTPIKAGEMSKVLAQMVIGLNDRLTELGLDENGETPDKTFHKPPVKK